MRRCALVEKRMRTRTIAALLKQTRWLTAADIAHVDVRGDNSVTRWERHGKIFSVLVRHNDIATKNRYAAYQFDDNLKPRPVIAQVLRIFSGNKDDPWKIAAWFGSNNGWLRGRAPKDCLDEPKRVIDAAKREIEGIDG